MCPIGQGSRDFNFLIGLFSNFAGDYKEKFALNVDKKRILVAGNNFMIEPIRNSQWPSFTIQPYISRWGSRLDLLLLGDRCSGVESVLCQGGDLFCKIYFASGRISGTQVFHGNV